MFIRLPEQPERINSDQVTHYTVEYGGGYSSGDPIDGTFEEGGDGDSLPLPNVLEIFLTTGDTIKYGPFDDVSVIEGYTDLLDKLLEVEDSSLPTEEVVEEVK